MEYLAITLNAFENVFFLFHRQKVNIVLEINTLHVNIYIY